MEYSTRLSVLIFLVMFIYSAITKIVGYNDKVSKLTSKTNLPLILNKLGMLGVIGLEMFGSLAIILHFYNSQIVSYHLAKITINLFLLFLIVVTLMYHPPWKKKIPFLSNLSTFAGFLFLDIILREKNQRSVVG